MYNNFIYLRNHRGDEGTIAKSPLQMVLDVAEKPDANQQVYLITVSRVLGATLPDGRAYKELDSLEREDLAKAVLASCSDPVPSAAGGCPRKEPAGRATVALLVVLREVHVDETVHFHIVVKFVRAKRFQSIKTTIRECFLLPSHFSCSHTLVWSATRYCSVATPQKPEVDETPWVWTPECNGFEADCG